ncbi:MAG: hypothetical protein Q7S36_02455 [Candidatus Liptonbacteria bacterium]|nr:hypothetical protein [Candidatus Liptonbacteria bacterium]
MEKIKKYRFTSAIFGLSFALVLWASLRAYFILRASSQPLILHFSEYAGITRIGSATDILLLGIFALTIILVNFALAMSLNAREGFLGKLITGATLFLAILTFIAISVILSVN